jgi:hypothetical protein
MKDRWESIVNVGFPFMYSQKWNCYFQNRIIMFCIPVSTLIYRREIYIFPGSVCLFCCREICGPILGIYINRKQTHECGNWDWVRAIPRKGIHRWDFPCSVGDIRTTQITLYVTDQQMAMLQKHFSISIQLGPVYKIIQKRWCIDSVTKVN